MKGHIYITISILIVAIAIILQNADLAAFLSNFNPFCPTAECNDTCPLVDFHISLCDPYASFKNLCTLALVLIALISAVVGYLMLRQTRNTNEATFVHKYAQTYFCSEMEEAVRELIALEMKVFNSGILRHGEGRSRENNPDSRIYRHFDKHMGEYVKDADKYRRCVESYFYNAYKLYDNGLITKKALRIIVDKAAFRLLFDFLEPFVCYKNAKYDYKHYYLLMKECSDIYETKVSIGAHFRDNFPNAQK